MIMDSESSPAFAVSRAALGGAIVLTPSGAVTYERCAEFRVALEQAAEAPRAAVVVDCRQVSLLDSEALELITEWHGKLQESGGKLALSNLNDVCSDILVVTRLIHLLNVHEDVRQAVRSGEA